MKTLFVTLLCCLMSINLLSGQSLNRPQGDNYIKGVEALNNGDVEEAYKYLNEEINRNPNNGYAHCYMALICNVAGDMKLALQAANTSLELIPENDAEYRSFAYFTRGSLLMNAKDYADAEKDLSEAIRLTPNDAENYRTRAEIYLNSGNYEASLADIQSALKLDSQADVFDLMQQLIMANPDPTFMDRVTTSYQGITAER